MIKKYPYDIIFSYDTREKKGVKIVDADIKKISSKDLIEMYDNSEKMKIFLDKEYKRLRGNDE